MAQGALFIGWGEIPAGKAKKALKVFNEAVEYWKRMQKSGEIESFEHVFLEAHGGDLTGFNLVKGNREKLGKLRFSPEFQRLVARVGLIVGHLGVVDAYAGEEVDRRLKDFVTQIDELD